MLRVERSNHARPVHGRTRVPRGSRADRLAVAEQIRAGVWDALERAGVKVHSVQEPRELQLRAGEAWLLGARSDVGDWEVSCRVWLLGLVSFIARLRDGSSPSRRGDQRRTSR